MTPRERQVMQQVRRKGLEVKRRRPDAGPIAAEPVPTPNKPSPAEAEPA